MEKLSRGSFSFVVSRFFKWDELNDQDAGESDETEEWDGDESKIVDPTNQAVVRTEGFTIRDPF